MLMVMVVAVGRGDAAVEGSKWGTEERKIITTAAVDTRFNETLPTHPLFFHTHTHTHAHIYSYVTVYTQLYYHYHYHYYYHALAPLR